MKIRTIIAEDEPIAREFLLELVSRIHSIEIVKACSNGQEAKAAIETLKPDLALLDINMPKLSGIALVEALDAAVMPMVIFITAYDKYAIKAFEANAIDYVLKPIDFDKVQKSVNRAISRFQIESETKELRSRILEALGSNKTDTKPENKPEAKILLKENGITRAIKQSDIIWLEAASDYVCIHCENRTHIKRASMKQFEKELEGTNFKRIHRSALVNCNWIEKIRQNRQTKSFEIILKTGKTLKISRNYSQIIDELSGLSD